MPGLPESSPYDPRGRPRIDRPAVREDGGGVPPATVSAAEQAEPSPTWAAAHAIFRALGSRRQVGAQFGGLVALLVVRSVLEAASIGALLALVPLLLPGSGTPSGWVTAMLGPGQAAGAWLSRIDLVLLAALALIAAKNLLLAAILVLRNKVAERWLVPLSTRLFALGLDEPPE